MASESTMEDVSEFLVYLFEASSQGEIEMKTPEGLSLTLVGSSVSVTEEHELRPLIASRIPSTGLYSNTGHMCNIGSELSPRACFFCLLEIPEAAKITRKDKDILVVMLCPFKQTLELFRPELETFCSQLVKPFSELFVSGSVIENFKGSVPATMLSTWYYDSILYLDRCVACFGAHLPLLLYLCILTDVEMTGDNQDVVKDIKLFLAATSLSSLVESNTDAPDGVKQCRSDPSNPLELKGTMNDQDWTVAISSSSTDLAQKGPQSFLCNWGKLVSSKENAFQRRQSIENFKLKIIQDVNSLKRLLQQAEADYHSLYKAYLFLCHSGNGEVLLNIAKMEAGAMGGDSTQAVAVVKAVGEFALSKKFTYIRQ